VRDDDPANAFVEGVDGRHGLVLVQLPGRERHVESRHADGRGPVRERAVVDPPPHHAGRDVDVHVVGAADQLAGTGGRLRVTGRGAPVPQSWPRCRQSWRQIRVGPSRP
jgi:hypothetical protein